MTLSWLPLRSNSQCRDFCATAAETGRLERGKNPTLDPWIEKIEELLSRIRIAMTNLENAKTTRHQVSTVHKGHVKMMELGVRHFRTILKNRVDRQNEPTYVFSHYKIPEKNVSGAKKPEEWRELALALIAGDERAVADGFPAMSNPDADEVRTYIDRYEEHRVANDAAHQFYQEARSTMAALRLETPIVAKGLASSLHMLMHDQGKAALHQAMLDYGFRFGSADSEQRPPATEKAEQQLDDIVDVVSPGPAWAKMARAQDPGNECRQGAEPRRTEREPAMDEQVPDWIDALFASPLYKTQLENGSRTRLEETRIRDLLVYMASHGGRSTCPALARILNIPRSRINGFLAVLQRLLNVDGYPTLHYEHDQVTLDQKLLLRQFEL